MQTKKSRPTGGAAYANARLHDNPVDAVLSRLDRVKQTAPDRWTALCPTHDDKRPSLSIREAMDQTVLLHCWAGCGAAEVVAALGLTLADLFPGDRRSLADHGTGPMRRPFSWADAMRVVAHEVTVARLITEAARRGEPLTPEDADRLALAESRIADALAAVGGAS